MGRPNMGSKNLFQSYVDGIWDRRWLSNSGPLAVELETRLADYLQVPHVVTMTNGTVALEIASIRAGPPRKSSCLPTHSSRRLTL